MKTTKNAILKYSPYTTALTRSLKATGRLHCRVNEENNAVYVCNGYFVVKLNPAEYDALVRPITQREAGNFVIENGEQVPNEPLDMEKILADSAREAAHELTPAPFTVTPSDKRSNTISPYYSESGDFVAGFNSDYAAIISAGLPRKSKSPTSPMVIYSGDEPQAMILPVRMDETKSRVPAAVRAYFTEKPQEPADKRVDRANQERDALRRQLECLRQQYAQQRADSEYLHSQFDRLQSVVADKNAEISALLDRLNAQPDPQPQEEAAAEEQQEQAPAGKAAALVEKLAALEGVTATIKGAQTAAPVVWLTGEADAHKDEIEKLGGKWSGKRSAWYFKIA